MSIKLRDMIRNVRACKTAAEERAVVAKECASIRTAFKEDDSFYRQRNVAKLLFVHMLGYPTQFGQLECLKLIASSKFPDKRVGYLGLTQLLDEDAEVLMLVTNSIKNDLHHPNQYIGGLALCALGNIATPQMCLALSREVEDAMTSSNPYLKKKSALCALRMIKKVEEVEDRFDRAIPSLFEDKNHGVLLAACSLVIGILEIDSSKAEKFRTLVPQLVRCLKSVLLSGYSHAAEYDVGGVTDPFLQVVLLRLLRELTKGSNAAAEDLNDVLAQVATNTEGVRTAGNSVLYECVRTITAVEADSGLRALSVNILGRFLQNRDNNIRFVALSTLQHVVRVEAKDVQRHRSTILECLKDPDTSVRRSALDVTFALINSDNVRPMVKELLQLLAAGDSEFKVDLISKICLAVEKFAPTRRWQLDTLVQLSIQGKHLVPSGVRDLFVHVVMTTPELHRYAVRVVFNAARDHPNLEALVQMSVWIVGELGDLLVSSDETDGSPAAATATEALDFLESVQRRNTSAVSSGPPSPHGVLSSVTSAPLAAPLSRGMTTTGTAELLATSLAKLTSRFPSQIPRIRKMLSVYDKSSSLELQQRACEYTELLEGEWESLRDGILDRMPLSERLAAEAEASSRPIGETLLDDNFATPAKTNGIVNGRHKKLHQEGGDLLELSDLLDLDASPPSAPTAAPAVIGGGDVLGLFAPIATPAVPASTGGFDVLGGSLPPPELSSKVLLDDLLGGLSLEPSTSSAPSTGKKAEDVDPLAGLLSSTSVENTSSSPPPSPPSLLKMEAYRKPPLEISFSLKRIDAVVEVLAHFINHDSEQLTQFVFEVAVPKYIQLDISPASSSVVGRAGGPPTTQKIRLTNSMAGKKPILLKLRISYTHRGQQISDVASVSNFPPEVSS